MHVENLFLMFTAYQTFLSVPANRLAIDNLLLAAMLGYKQLNTRSQNCNKMQNIILQVIF
jgi:hypothetical protein